MLSNVVLLVTQKRHSGAIKTNQQIMNNIGVGNINRFLLTV